MLSIKNNIMAATAARNLGKSYEALSQSVERLSSGQRINSAKDDAAGMAVRELIRADVSVLNQGSRNAQDGISMLQTMEAGMGVMDDNLVRMKELAEQAATGSYSSAQRDIMNAEFAEMADEIERVANATKFNNIAMLNQASQAAGANDVKIHVGTTTTIDVARVNMTKEGLDIQTGDGGWRADTRTATGVASTSTTWLAINQNASAGTTLTLTLQFTDSGATAHNEAAVNVFFTVTSASQTSADNYSLASVVNTINAASMSLGFDTSGNDLRYSAAEAVYDATSGKYVLRVKSRETNADSYDMQWSGLFVTTGGTDAGYVSIGFTLTADGHVTSTTFMANSGVAQAGLNIKTVDAAVTALARLETAINTKDTARASFGYKMNRLESAVAILGIQSENLSAAESRISDVDVATEMAKLTSTQVLAQAGVQMLAQANSIPQMAMTLLRT